MSIVNPKTSGRGEQHPLRFLDQLRQCLRLRRYGLRTEDAYVDWVRRFVLLHGKRHPQEMGAQEVMAFLTYLAVERHVSASTQNQTKAALLFMYKHMLSFELPWLEEVVQAKSLRRLPVVISQGEVRLLLQQMEGQPALVARLLYGTGLRLLEGLRLRIQDIDFDLQQIVVRDGKGANDRITMLPESLVLPLKKQINHVKALHERDVTDGFGEVFCQTPWRKNTPMSPRLGCGNGYFPPPCVPWTPDRV